MRLYRPCEDVRVWHCVDYRSQNHLEKHHRGKEMLQGHDSVGEIGGSFLGRILWMVFQSCRASTPTASTPITLCPCLARSPSPMEYCHSDQLVGGRRRNVHRAKAKLPTAFSWIWNGGSGVK